MARQSLLNVVLGLDSRKFERGLTTAQKKIRNTANSLSSVGRGLSLGVTAPLGAIGASSFKVAADFELAMKKVKAVSGATGQEFASLEKNARDLGASTVFSASSVSDLQLSFAKLGLSAGEITSATESTLALAQAFGQELGPTADTVGTTLAQFGLEAESAGDVADIMATAFAGSALDLEKFSESMKNAAPVANEFGFSLEETTALLGVLANNGIAGSDAGTKLKMAFSELAAQGVDVKDTFTGLINGSLSYSDAIKVLGKRAAILQPIFGKNLEDLEDLGKELKNSGGKAKSMAAEMDDTANGGLAAMRSAIEAAQISLGTALAPTVTKVIDKIKRLATSFSQLSPETQGTVVKFGLFAAALGPVTSAIGGLIRGVQNSVKAFKAASLFLTTNPYGVVLLGAAALGTALYNMSQDSYMANDAVLDFNETIDAQNDLLSDGVKQLAARGVLLREAFALEAEGQTIGALQKQTSALRSELENISPEAFGAFFAKQVEIASNSLMERDLGIVPAINFETGEVSQQAREANAAIIAEAAGVEFSPFVLDIILAADPFGDGLSTDDAFDTVEEALTTKLQKLQGDLDEQTAALESKVEIVVDVNGGDGKKPEATLESVQAALEKTLTATTELETLFGKDLSSDKFSAIETAVRKIVEADFAGADAVLADLVSRMAQFAEVAETAQTPFEALQETLKSLSVQQGLGIVTDLQAAQTALAALDEALTQSILNDPEFANTERFAELVAQAENFRSLLAETTDQQVKANEALFTAQDAGAAVSDLVELGFKSATGEVENFGQAATRMLGNIALQAVKAAIAQAISLAFSPTPDNVATAGAAGVAKAAGYKAAIAALLTSVPKLHSGGLTMGPTLALIGDNPSGREAVIPFERMGSFLGQVAGTNNNMNVTGRIHGTDIVLSHERARRNRAR